VTQRASQRAYEITKRDILSARLPGGTLLSEVEVAEQLSVSRTPVHEAFLRLESENLLRLLPRRGALVVPVAPGEGADILDVRLTLETGAVRGIGERGLTVDGLSAELAGLVAEQATLAAAGDVASFAAMDERFHAAIVAAAGNAVATRFYTSLAERQRRMTITSVGSRPELLIKLVDEHRALAARVGAGDEAGFRAALAGHLATTHNLYHSR
jgi:DNA-binding GntR family transcriptional regulator